MKKLLILTAAIYCLAAALTYHPDTKLTLYYPTLGGGKVWDIYKFLERNPDNAPPFHYPPLHFWALKAELPVVKFFGGPGITGWLKSNGNSAFLDPKIYQYNLATKIPLIIMLLFTGYFIYRLVGETSRDEQAAVKAARWWLLNPVTLYSAVIMGQNDILALLPFVAGWYFLRKKPVLAFGLFGIAAGIKSYPLIWAVILALGMPKTNLIRKIGYALIPMIIYGLTMLPFIGSRTFLNDVVFSGLSIRIFEAQIAVGFSENVLVVPLILGGLILIYSSRKAKEELKSQALILTAATTAILGFSHFHPQWFIWIIPFLAVLRNYLKLDFVWLWLLASLAVIILMFEDKFLYWGLLTPVNPGLINLPLFSTYLLSKGVDQNLPNNLAHSAIAAAALFFGVKAVGDEK